MNLRDCLAQVPFRNLLIIARLHNVSRGQNPPKATLVQRLTAALQRPEALQETLRQLTPDQRQALDALVSAGGRMPWPAFRERFGVIRPYRPWQDDEPRHPWKEPVSPAEGLWFWGLIYRFPRRPRADLETQVLIPEELLALLPTSEEPAVTRSLIAAREQTSAVVGNIVTDVALFISLLHRQDIHPRWDRWLPPRHLRELNQRLSVSEDMSQIRSELQTGRLRFVHFLAETAGLVGLAPSTMLRTGSRWLKPTPGAWQWLEQASPARYETLWTAWRERSEANQTLWQRYRLPGHDVAVVLDILDVVLGHLAEFVTEQSYGIISFSETLAASESILSTLPLAWRDDEVHNLGSATVAALLAGPLARWGVVSIAEQDGEPAFALTPLGRWLLAGGEAGPSTESWTGPPADETAIHVDSGLTILVPDTVHPLVLVRVEAVADWRGWVDGNRRYQVTQESLSRALSRSMSLQEIIDTLSRGQDEGLGAEQVATLKAWMAESQAVRLRTVTLLETRDAGRLQELSANRTLHKYFRETLSPRAVVVDAKRVDNLVRALQRQGAWPQVDLPPGEGAGKVSHTPAADTGAAAHLWIAGQVYAKLSRWIDLPHRMPAAVLDDLAAHMSSDTYAVARQAVEDASDRLAEAMDGWAQYPMPGAGLPPEETLPVIEMAIADGQRLEMTYWTAGRGVQSTRTVDPYRIEWRGDVPYLIGYCHARLAQRVFRLDRLQRLKVEG